jgi:hypothetical protein
MKVKLFNGVDWSINKNFKRELDILLTDVMQDEMDLVIPVTGPEGVGKSFFMRGLASYCATFLGSDFCVDNIHFDLPEYKEASLKGSKFTILVMDEARKVLGRSKYRDKEVNLFLDYLSECRKKQQVHILGLPAYHDLAAYVIKWRVPMIIQLKKNYVVDATSPSGFRMKRGEYRVYTDKTQIIYWYDHPYYYPKKYAVRDWWSSKEVFTSEQVKAYEDKKDYFTYQKYSDETVQGVSVRIVAAFRRHFLKNIIKYYPSMTQKEIALIFGVGQEKISKDLKFLKEKGEIERPNALNKTNEIIRGLT